MTAEQFLTQVKSGKMAPVYLFLGPDAWRRDRCRKALLDAWFSSEEEREQGFTRLDLEETSLRDAVDDAMAMSLFATRRVIWVTSAEVALPRGRAAAAAAAEEGDEGGGGEKTPSALETYLKNPSPDVILILQCSRYGFDGDDKAKVERVAKYYAGVKAQVEFPHPTTEEAYRLAQTLAKTAGITLQGEALELLLEAVGNNATRLATEIEKLSLLTVDGAARTVTLEMVQNMVPDARQTTIFALVAAMGRRDRVGSLEYLDTLVREGEYLPLALSFLAGQFRLALTAKEARLSNSFQIQQYFQKIGVQMWKSKADQVAQTAQVFSVAQLRNAIQQLFQADRGLRDIRPDDRTVMERLILQLTA